MTEERVHRLDGEALRLFARKGEEAGPGAPQICLENGLKVRRVMQITRDLSGRPFEELRILDLGCGEGVYAIEAGLRGAEVVALDARDQRMGRGADCAARHGLGNVRFVREDVRRATREALGSFDAVYLLGLLYHLDTPDVFSVLENVAGLCARLLIVDTLISPAAETEVEWRGETFLGKRFREHADEDADDVRRGRVLKSIDNTFSFRFTRESLLKALQVAGFTSVSECRVPFEPGKADDRITLAAVRGTPVVVSTYPWVNGRPEAEIENMVRSGELRKPGRNGDET
jgi:2-polyprenyl-3-methyl-5-hydroxy-6-metoxy-1,4-benzoquinol methylase